MTGSKQARSLKAIDELIIEYGEYVENLQAEVLENVPAYTAQIRTANAVRSTLRGLISLRVACDYAANSGDSAKFTIPCAWRKMPKLMAIVSRAQLYFKNLDVKDSEGLTLRDVEPVEFLEPFKQRLADSARLNALAA